MREPSTIDLTQVQHGGPTVARESIQGYPTVSGYEILRELGRGGMGVVFEAKQSALDRRVAIKLMQKDDGLYQARFLAEGQIIAAVHHPHVVEIYDFGESNSRPYIAMELLEGGSLGSRFKQGTLPARDAVSLIAQVSDGVGAVHDLGIVHRDLKPGNVLLDAGGIPKVTDFGLAKRTDFDLTLTHEAAGTPSYMAPEQARAMKFVGPPADVWSLGVMLYESLTGRKPFVADSDAALLSSIQNENPPTLRSISKSIPNDLETICLKCLEKEPERRYATAKELAADLRAWLDGRPISARRATPIEKAMLWVRRKPAVAAAWALGVLVVVALAFTLLSLRLWLEADALYKSEAKARAAETKARELADKIQKQNDELLAQQRRTLAKQNKRDLFEQIKELKNRALWKQAFDLSKSTSAALSNDLSSEEQRELQDSIKSLEFLTKLDTIRLRKAATAVTNPDRVWNLAEIRTEYEAAFREAGFQFRGPDRESTISNAVELLKNAPMRTDLIAALDDWAWLIRDEYGDRIWEATARSTGQEWRKDLRFASVSSTEAIRLSRDVPTRELTSPLICGMAMSMRLVIYGDQRLGIGWLEAGAKQFPNDFWIKFYLGVEYLRHREYPQAAGAFRAAVALRPDEPLSQKCFQDALEKSKPPAK